MANTLYTTLSQLEEAAPKLEAALTAMDRYVATQPASELMDPALGYVQPKKTVSVQDRNQQQGRDRSQGRPQHQDRRPPQQQQPAARRPTRPPFVRYNNPHPVTQQVQATGGNAEPVKTPAAAAAPNTGRTTTPAATGAFPKVAAELRKFNCYSCGQEGQYANACPKKPTKSYMSQQHLPPRVTARSLHRN